MNPDKIVIIGATGLIGQEFVRSLISDNLNPIILSRNPIKAKKIFGGNIQIERWNYSDIDSLITILNNSSALVNLAGENIATRWTRKKRESILKSRLVTTNAIVQAVKKCTHPPSVFIQASAIGYYHFNANVQIDEDGEPGNGFLSQVVRQWEQTAVEIENVSRLVIIRTGIVLSPHGGFLKKIIVPTKFFLGGWIGDGNQILSWIHIEDHIRAIRFLIENKEARGIYNLVAPNPISNKHFEFLMGKFLKRPIWLPIPSLVVKFIFGKMADEVILSSQNIVSSRLSPLGFNFRYQNAAEALENLIEHKSK